MSLPWRPLSDDSLLHLMTVRGNTDLGSTYGIIGALLVTVGPVVVVARRRFDFPAALFLAGVAAHVLLALRLGWHPANLRYFVAAACLAWAGMSLLVVSASPVTSLASRCSWLWAMLVPFGVPAGCGPRRAVRDGCAAAASRQMIAREEVEAGR